MAGVSTPSTDAINTDGDLHFEYPRWITRLSGGEDPPTAEGEASDVLRATNVVQSAGGQQLDYCNLSWTVTEPLTNRDQPANFTRMVDVLLPNSSKTRLCLCDYTNENEKVDDRTEELTAQGQVRPYHYGAPFQGERWYDPIAEEDIVVDWSPTFNPRVDGKVLANRSNKTHDEAASADVYNWIHPEATLTSEAETDNDQVATKWSLKDAVFAMMWNCNFDETHIENTLYSDLDLLDDAPPLEDVRLPIGEYLPFYLDRLLQPLGFNWCVDYDRGSGWEPDPPRIRVFQKGVGDEKQLKYQAPNEKLDLSQTNCRSYEINRRIGDSVNIVRVLGAYEQAEVTIPLVRSWPEDDDSLTPADLDKSNTGSQYEAKPTVHRLFVGNEAGDYTGIRPEITEALDLSPVFEKCVPHRRTISDPFTWQGGDGRKQRRQVYVEYDGPNGWRPLPDEVGQPFLLPDQIGILFTADEPPSVLMSPGTAVRITCVITGDARLTYTADRDGREDYGANGRDVEMTLDVPQKFRKNWVQDTGPYASVLKDDPSGADTADDTTAIQDYAEAFRDQHEVAEIDCQFVLPGIHLTYKIGDLITRISGREVSLDQATSASPNPRYVQVVRREFQMEPPMTTLTVDRGTPPVVARPRDLESTRHQVWQYRNDLDTEGLA